MDSEGRSEWPRCYVYFTSHPLFVLGRKRPNAALKDTELGNIRESAYLGVITMIVILHNPQSRVIALAKSNQQYYTPTQPQNSAKSGPPYRILLGTRQSVNSSSPRSCSVR